MLGALPSLAILSAIFWRSAFESMDDLRVLLPLVIEQVSQLAELSGAVGSPIPAIEHEHHVLPVAKARQRDGPTILRLQGEVRRWTPHRHPPQVCRQEAGAVRWAQLRGNLRHRHGSA